MPERIAHEIERTESRFKEFTDRLLNAEHYAFSARDVFNPASLQTILCTFCDIIADELHAQSCTVQLKVYARSEITKRDERSNPQEKDSIAKAEDDAMADRKEKLKRVLKGAPEDEKQNKMLNKIIEARKRTWFGTTAYPYPFHPKGMVKLVAASRSSPWHSYLHRNLVAALRSGVTLDILQDRSASVRDPLSIRSTRNMIKLGGSDHEIWDGDGPDTHFFNYYGVPVRIHAGGEAIGILKVENKGLHGCHLMFRIADFSWETKNNAVLPEWFYQLAESPVSDAEDVINPVKAIAIDLKQQLERNPIKSISDLQTLFIRNLNRSVHQTTNSDDPNAYKDRVHDKYRTLRKALGKALLPKDSTDDYDCQNQHLLWRVWLSPNPAEAITGLMEKDLLLESSKTESSKTNRFSPVPLARSLFSLAYLELDFDSCEHPDWGKISYPEKSPLLFEEAGSSKDFERWKEAGLIPSDSDTPPPVQIMFDTLQAERDFVLAVFGKRTIKEYNRYKKVRYFYFLIQKAIHSRLRKLGTTTKTVEQLVPEAFRTALKKCNLPFLKQYKISNDPCEGKPRFCYPIQLTPKESANKTKALTKVKVYVVVLPPQNQLKDQSLEREFAAKWGFLDQKRWNRLRKVNSDYLGQAAIPSEPDGNFHGELIDLNYGVVGRSKRENGLVHFLSDRLAARRQALAFAAGVDNFNTQDALMVSWAAVEIGKLVERQISYRGNHLVPNVPLTAMEFFRLPISSMSFVDDLRAQLLEGEGVCKRLEYDLRNEVSYLGFDDSSLKLSTRVKPFRSYFERLSERNPKVENAVVTLWLYLLSLLLKDGSGDLLAEFGKEGHENSDAKEFVGDLEKLYAQIETLCSISEPTQTTGEKKESFLKIINERFPASGPRMWGDLGFTMALFDLEGESSDEPSQLLAYLQKCLVDNLKEEKSHFNPDDQKSCEDLLFRVYDPYMRSAMSLLIQIRNRREWIKDGWYEAFYTACVRLKTLLSDTEDELEGHQAFENIQKHVANLRMFLLKYQTDDFIKFYEAACNLMQNPKSPPAKLGDALFLGVKGVYKRARMMLNVLRHQRSPKELGWELSKLDYVGARLDCLFKNQGFATYEQIWGRMDPFFPCSYRKQDKSQESSSESLSKRVIEPEGFIIRNHSPYRRQRALAVRTVVHQGRVYHATQVTAFMDPAAIEPGYWESSIYTLSKLSFFLGCALCRFNSETAQKYISLNYNRQCLRERYVQWFKMVNNLLARKDIRTELEPKDVQELRWFGAYLCEAAIDS